MAKLVILNQGMTGRTFELSGERTTVGRVDDNSFQIPDPSVSSHHAEILLRGADIVVKDLNTTNGSYLNDNKITEIVLQPGQVLRFGQVELKIDDGKPVSAPPPVAAPAPVTAAKKPSSSEATMVMPRGVRMSDLEESGTRTGGFDTSAAFSKKTNKANRVFIAIGVVVFVIILGLIIVALKLAK
jgi:pSer/pThr/pTyr-binding forkhead associated (FHA) protein